MADASGEILIMLLVSFVLGVMFGHLIHRSKREKMVSDNVIHLPASTQTNDISERVDDLQVIEGIGPKIEQQLNKHGITSWYALAETPISRLEEILTSNGEKFRAHKPNTWPQQARLAHEGRFAELKALQEVLTGGRP